MTTFKRLGLKVKRLGLRVKRADSGWTVNGVTLRGNKGQCVEEWLRSNAVQEKNVWLLRSE
jgi:hypothetical protein